jgi:hypothetical protein
MCANTKILKRQQKFSSADLSSKEPFTHLFDRGFRCTLPAFEAGGQKCIQPHFAKSDRTFNTHEVLTSAQIAALRSGNERAVRTTNISWRIKHGASLQAFSPAMLADAG